MSPPTAAPFPLHDTLIIGAGPSGLAVAARLREETPSAMFTDDEHQRYHWINKHRGRMALVQARQSGSGQRWKQRGAEGVRAERYRGVQSRFQPGSLSSGSDSGSSTGSDIASSPPGLSSSVTSSSSSFTEEEEEEEQDDGNTSTLVLDSSAPRWMEKWNRAFKTLEIEQLRSPMFFHVDPRDRDGMLAYTQEAARGAELWEISGPPAEPEIDERDRKDYFAPSTRLFADYCQTIVARYRLNTPGLIRQSEVVDIQYGDHAEGKIFTVTAADGSKHYSRTVVLAIGPGSQKIFPFPLSPAEQHGACHSADIRGFPSPNVAAKIRRRQPSHLVVVGGGLSSAQIVDMAVRRGVTKVWLLMRSEYKVKHFDLALNWMGKFKNLEKARFWSADSDEERAAIIQLARGGGSITPHYTKLLKQHAARGAVSIHPRTVLTSHTYHPESQTWSLATDPPIPALADTPIDYIYFATGMRADVAEMPLLQSMRAQYPVDIVQGLPCLTEDLMWRDGVPLFLAGRLAALRLGPGAANLDGARLGAERIAWGMEEFLGRGPGHGKGGQVEGEGERERERACFCGLGNRFKELEFMAEDEEERECAVLC
ncbi:FAD binding domain protein [Aspergillus homomorphus CBS 101889]|uniref:L-ornithine N(5)-monooxygenase n=1 Tax=Aspergillus homomorphus (strain CBS 101889) TaxID=1450537 RepID=A0A395I5N0_ASPHC|nr:hypothetical protein BO97DRAFT_475874 [Aspergillus homomorphus CBS 101889]RAL15511.1 hypothetical protein BO97DRAFT_475874 [Aspergillus homomorphus CBS 101889]